MNSHRVFLAFLLPPSLKNKILNYQKSKIPSNFFRLTPPENLHLTLIFLGYLSENHLFLLKKICPSITAHYPPLKIEFHKITLGPLKSAPRLIWLEGKPSPLISQLRTEIEKEIIRAEIPYQPEERIFHPHITLARLNKHISHSQLDSLKNLTEKFPYSFTASNLWLMESQLKPAGAEYKKQAQFNFTG